MGYDTRYKLLVIPHQPKDFYQDLELDGEEECFDVPRRTRNELVTEPFDVWEHQERSWYAHDEELIAISRRFPALVFQLDGEGEESGDVWRTFYRDGLLYRWSATIEPPEYATVESMPFEAFKER